MAHIVSCMLDFNGEKDSTRSNLDNSVSPGGSTESLASTSSLDEKKPYVWRMAQPEPRKYQLFPKDRQPAPPVVKQFDHEQPTAVPVAASTERSEKTSITSDLRQRIKEHNLNRRRKISVPELGPMTTVQEVAMDSPTIPGRPALHERSISSPANSGRHHHLATLMSTYQSSDGECSERITAPRSAFRPDRAATAQGDRQPLSPKDLAPLVIPKQPSSLPQLARKISMSRLMQNNTSQDSCSLASKADDSPKTRTLFTPFTPVSSSVSCNVTPRSANTVLTASTLPTPISAPAEHRCSPHPWEKPAACSSDAATHNGATDVTSTPKGECRHVSRSPPGASHKRGQSDSGSIMERGRPRRRYDGSIVGASHKRSGSKCSISTERLAFETLPQGLKPSEAVIKMDQAEVSYLKKQAVGQALRFEILRKEDVEGLSKELRHLDDRTEYLRSTYTSLRASRRNLHSRICQYLRSARVAKFSYESMLKQEEALAELDASINDWVNKLEHAENRRTRVRQKLLEHVAAAATLPNAMKGDISAAQPLTATSNLSTPPQSPAKTSSFLDVELPLSPSPQRVVARVPSVIPEQPAEEEDSNRRFACRDSEEESALKRMESIRIYADSDVYALLADVESEFTKLNGEGVTSPELSAHPATCEKQRELHRALSHDILIGDSRSGSATTTRATNSPAPSPHMKDSPKCEGETFLTAAVFRPE